MSIFCMREVCEKNIYLSTGLSPECFKRWQRIRIWTLKLVHIISMGEANNFLGRPLATGLSIRQNKFNINRRITMRNCIEEHFSSYNFMHQLFLFSSYWWIMSCQVLSGNILCILLVRSFTIHIVSILLNMFCFQRIDSFVLIGIQIRVLVWQATY